MKKTILIFYLLLIISPLGHSETPKFILEGELLAFSAQEPQEEEPAQEEEEIKFTPAQEDSLRKMIDFYNRFSDTTFIKLDDIQVKSEKTYLQGYDLAVEDFDAGNYEEALNKFKLYAETLPPSDSLYFEIDFFIAECYVAQNDLNNAKYILEHIELNPDATDAVMEKVLVRIGQIWCVLDNQSRAEQYFTLLRDKYPNSIYIALADCSLVR
jgi:TolA-binding protein